MQNGTPNPDTKPTRRGLFWRLARLLAPYRGLFVLALVLTLTGSVLHPIRPYLFQYVIDNHMAAGDMAALRAWVLIITGLVLVQAILSYWQTWVTNWLGQRVMNDLRQQIYNHILSLRLKYFDNHPIGTLQTRVISDIQTLQNVFSEGLVNIVGELLTVVGIMVLMFYIDWRLTLVVLSMFPLILLATRLFQMRVRTAFERVRTYVGKLNAFLQEHITGMLITQIFNREREEYRKFEGINRQHRKAHLDSVLYYSIFFPVIEILSALGTALLVWYGAGAVLQQQVSMGVLVSFLMYITMFFRPIRMLADQFNTLQMGLVSAERVFKVLDTDEHIADKTDGLTQAALRSKPVDIVFDQVQFAYTAGEPILRGVSFEVPAGTTTAIVGATGAGKSSVINTLTRFYEIDGGSIRVGGHDVREFQLAALRAGMGLVMQDVFLFSGSVRDNITLFDTSIAPEAIVQAAKLVGAHDFIEQLPGGYDYRVGERGAMLSAGQRQLISFVRVLVYNPPVLLLDEATAQIDTHTEELIQHAIETVLRGRTSIIIAHRLSTIQRAHQILVMHRGEVVERGTHQQLLGMNGFYKKLYLMQYGQQALAT